MYAENHAEIESLQSRFDQEAGDHSPSLRITGDAYLLALTTFITAAGEGTADSRLSDLDTTGEVRRVDDYVAWAEQERHRVRHALHDVH